MTWKLPVQNFKVIGPELTEKSTQNMRQRFTKEIINCVLAIIVRIILNSTSITFYFSGGSHY